MKKILAILAVLLLTDAALAQNFEKNIFGIRAGLNLSSLSASIEGLSVSTSSRTGFFVAVSDQILLSSGLPLYLETGLGISSRGGKADEMTMRPLYLQIPLLINYHIDIRNIVSIQPFAGLYYGLGIAGKAKGGGEKADIFGEDSGLKRSDLGVRLGAGVGWNRLYFGLSYDIGCLNQLKSKLVEGMDLTLRNSCFTISIGYNF